MPDLTKALQGNDLSFLRMVADAWNVELTQPDAATALPVLVAALKSPARIRDVLEQLEAEPYGALQTLLEQEGRMPWATFCRQFGEVRPMGPGRRDRERPDLNPASVTEILWYRGLIGKAFLNLPPEPQEFAYLPDDFIEHFHPMPQAPRAPIGRAASKGETASPLPAADAIIDQSCTLLAALRIGLPADFISSQISIPLAFLTQLLQTAGLIDDKNQLQPEAVRVFLEAERGEALAALSRAWMDSQTLNELRLLPGLIFSGSWDNHPRQTRHILLDLLSHLPNEKWWSLKGFISGIREKNPDFQRPGGDYDSWFIQRASDKNFLRGFDTWDEVDGALVRFMICGPLHWLGWFDLAAPDPTAPPAAFRPSRWAEELWQGKIPKDLTKETAQLRATSDGRLRLPAYVPRPARYQISRFCEWEGETDGEFRYRLTPASLERARQQGLQTNHLLALLRRHAVPPLPPSLLQSLERLEKFGVQASLEPAILLRLASPELLAALRKTRAARFLGEALSPLVVTVKPGGEEPVRQALAELGYLAEEQV